MDKKHQKRGNKAYTGSPTLIYMDILQKKTGGEKSSEVVTLNVKGEKKRTKTKEKERDQRHEDMGSA
jgi:hypothetical protein